MRTAPLCSLCCMFLFYGVVFASTGGKTCDPVHLPQRGPGPVGAVCRCTAESCDSVAPLDLLATDTDFVFYQTSLSNDTDRLSRHTGSFVDSAGGDWQHIVLDPNQTYQSIIGFGGALTDAAAINFQKLDAKVQQHVINSYYSDDGIEYSLGRIPMAGCDFSTHVYSYDDVAEEDLNLTHFSVFPVLNLTHIIMFCSLGQNGRGL